MIHSIAHGIECSLATTYVNLALASLVLLLLLLNDLLDEGRFRVQIDTVLVLEIVDIVVEESLVAAQLLSDRQDVDLVDSGLGAHSLH